MESVIRRRILRTSKSSNEEERKRIMNQKQNLLKKETDTKLRGGERAEERDFSKKPGTKDKGSYIEKR
jgi:hypothetical protein